MLKNEGKPSGAVEELKRSLGDKWRKIEETKKTLDAINFSELYKRETCYDDKLGIYLPKKKTEKMHWSELEPLEESEIDQGNQPVAKMYANTFNKMPQHKGIRLGTVSNGVHATELIERYFTTQMVKNIKHWNITKVMVVYEAPASNLDCCHALMNRCDDVNNKKSKVSEIIKEYINDSDNPKSITDSLTHRWWRLDEELPCQKTSKNVQFNPEKNCSINKCFECFMNKSYTGFLLALISYFGLANLYTTNYCRIELFKEKMEKSKESYLNWQETMEDCSKVFFEEEKFFNNEYNSFKPDIVLATANPYYRMKEKNNKTINSDSPVNPDIVVKMIHPASRYPRDLRLCYNMCTIARELERCEDRIIARRAKDVFNHFWQMGIPEYAINDEANKNEKDPD